MGFSIISTMGLANIGHYAHLGGLLTGFLIIIAINPPIEKSAEGIRLKNISSLFLIAYFFVGTIVLFLF